MVFFGILRTVTWLAFCILVNDVQFGRGLAADRNHRWSVDEPTSTDLGVANTDDVETTPLQNASHSEAYVAVHGSANHSWEDGPPREAVGKLPELTIANRSVSKIHSHRNASTSAFKSSSNTTAANLNVSSTEHAFNDSMRNSTADSPDVANYSQAESIIRATLCPNGSAEKETMRIEVEFASTLLENGLYCFIIFSRINERKT